MGERKRDPQGATATKRTRRGCRHHAKHASASFSSDSVVSSDSDGVAILGLLRMDSNASDGRARRLLARLDGALVLQLAHVDGIDVHVLEHLDELVQTVGLAVELAGVVVGRINLGAQFDAGIGQLHLQPLVQVVIHRLYHEINAFSPRNSNQNR